MKKPSEIKSIDIKYGIIPPKDFLAITWFGKMYINKKNKEEWEGYNDTYKRRVVRHEMIHVHQAEKEHDSWFCFYMKYFWYWLKAMFLCGFKNSIAYYCVPYEVEAYIHEKQPLYKLSRFNFYQKVPIRVYVELKKASDSTIEFATKIAEMIEEQYKRYKEENS